MRLSALLVLLAFAIVPAAAQTQAPIEVNFGLNAPGAANWIYYIADRQGFFRDEGLRVTLITSGTPTNTVNLLASGDVGMALNGTDNWIEAIAHHLPIKIVAPELIPNPYIFLTVPPVPNWAALKGKSVLLGPKGDSSSITFTVLMEKLHMKLDDFSIVPGSTSSNRYAALLTGNIGGTILSEPFNLVAIEKGNHPLARVADYVKDWLDTCYAVNTNWAANNRATVVRMVRALKKAAAYGYDHPDGATAALIAATNIAPDTAAKVYEADFRKNRVFDPNLRMDVKRLQFMDDLLQRFGNITTALSISDIYDSSYISEASRGR